MHTHICTHTYIHTHIHTQNLARGHLYVECANLPELTLFSSLSLKDILQGASRAHLHEHMHHPHVIQIKQMWFQ